MVVGAAAHAGLELRFSPRITVQGRLIMSAIRSLSSK